MENKKHQYTPMNQKNVIQKIKQIKVLLEECLVELSAQQDKKLRDANKDFDLQNDTITGIDFDFEIPLRPFIKRHARGLSGPKKFVLLLAWLTKGDENKEIPLVELRARWDKMKGASLLGFKFNRFYSAEAYENNWVEKTKRGMYKLQLGWHKILHHSKNTSK